MTQQRRPRGESLASTRSESTVNPPSPSQSPAPSENEGLSSSIQKLLPPTVVALYENNQGLALITLAQFFFAAMSLSVKFLMETTEMSTLTLIFVRMGITGACTWATLLIQGDPNTFLGPPGIRRLLCWRGFCGFSGLLCAYQALRGLSVSDTVTIGFLAPSVTALLAYLVMGEHFSLKESMSGLASLIGVVLISRPPFLFGHGWGHAPLPIEPDAYMRVRPASTSPEDDEAAARMLGVTWALSGVFFSASAYLSIRYIGKRANALHSISYFSMACTLVSGIAIIFTPNLQWPHDKYGFMLIVVIGIFGFIAQTLLTFGLQREKAGRAGLAMYLQIFFAVILEFLVFHTVPSFLSFIGMTIILSSAGWIAMSSLKTSPPPVVSDPESRPISRTPSPAPPPGTKTLRGELYSYSGLPRDDLPTASSSTTLNVPPREDSPVKKEEE